MRRAGASDPRKTGAAKKISGSGTASERTGRDRSTAGKMQNAARGKYPPRTAAS